MKPLQSIKYAKKEGVRQTGLKTFFYLDLDPLSWIESWALAAKLVQI